MAFERARIQHRPLFAVFVDLEKAYDCIDRARLFTVLARELGAAEALVATLIHMYTGVRG